MPVGIYDKDPSEDHFNDRNEELIESYFEETLSKEEVILFAEKIKNDPEFAEIVALQQTLRKAANLPNSEFRAKVHQKVKAKRNRNRLLLFLAAVVLALLLFGLFYFSNPLESEKLLPNSIASTRGITPPIDNQSPTVYAENIQIPLLSLLALSTQVKEINEDLTPFLIPYKDTSFYTKPNSLNLYQNGSYQPFLQNCAVDVQQLKNADKYKTLVLKGSAELFTGAFKNANITLQSVLDKAPTQSTQDAAHYYLAITQLYLGQSAPAKSNLGKIVAAPYNENARQLLMLIEEKEF